MDQEKEAREQELEILEKEYNQKKLSDKSSEDFDFNFKAEIFSGFNYQGYKKRFHNTTPNIYDPNKKFRKSITYSKLPSIRY